MYTLYVCVAIGCQSFWAADRQAGTTFRQRPRWPAIVATQVKTKGARKISYAQFKDALVLVATKKGGSPDSVVETITSASGPLTNATQADYVKFHDNKVRPCCCRPPCVRINSISLGFICVVYDH